MTADDRGTEIMLRPRNLSSNSRVTALATLIAIAVPIHACTPTSLAEAEASPAPSSSRSAMPENITLHAVSFKPPSGNGWSGEYFGDRTFYASRHNLDGRLHSITATATIIRVEDLGVEIRHLPITDLLAISVITEMSRGIFTIHPSIQRFQLEAVGQSGAACFRGKADGQLPYPYEDHPIIDDELYFLACMDERLSEDEWVLLAFLQSAPAGVPRIDVQDDVDQFFQSLALIATTE